MTSVIWQLLDWRQHIARLVETKDGNQSDARGSLEE